jgi:hypothetical protein
LPFANVAPNELGSGVYDIPGSKHQIEFGKPEILSTSKSHFLRIDVAQNKNSLWEISIQAFDESGKCAQQKPKTILLV